MISLSRTTALRPLLRTLRSLRGVVAVFALIAQLGFLAHQAEHHVNFSLAVPDDCAMCQFGTSMAAAPEAAPVPIPASAFFAVVSHVPDSRAPRTFAAAAFRSRAPPLSRI